LLLEQESDREVEASVGDRCEAEAGERCVLQVRADVGEVDERHGGGRVAAMACEVGFAREGVPGLV
jgi:hypothetical protein